VKGVIIKDATKITAESVGDYSAWSKGTPRQATSYKLQVILKPIMLLSILGGGMPLWTL
jgi:hypothetical protein